MTLPPTHPQHPPSQTQALDDRRTERTPSQDTEYFSTASSPAPNRMDRPGAYLNDAIAIDSDSEDEGIIFTGYSGPPPPSGDNCYFVGQHGPLRFALDLRWKERLSHKIEVGGGKVVSLADDPNYFVADLSSATPLSQRRFGRLAKCSRVTIVSEGFVYLAHASKSLPDPSTYAISLESLSTAPLVSAPSSLSSPSKSPARRDFISRR
ncbi:uncharacterized protein LOC62_04G006214 [Vanrija pseudolonga]|uniref:Uncharacterized protein n=1 Tax=Vanrija pseudolonga TaxID=143232 RepID=A0AAF0YDB2_9TREE|nr:hypothetical protein LOC62_04G006214 [Vanrija pseudolonga]